MDPAKPHRAGEPVGGTTEGIRSIAQAIEFLPCPDDASVLIALVHGLRPARASDGATATAAVRALTERLQARPEDARALRHNIGEILAARQHRYLYADTGITRAEGLFRGIASRVGAKFLPRAPHDGYLRDLFFQLFDRSDDHVWVQAVSIDDWQALWTALGIEEEAELPGFRRAQREILEAMNLLAVRLQTLACEPEIIRLHVDEHSDPMVFEALATLTRGFARGLSGSPEASESRRVLLQDAIADCDRELSQWRRLMRVHGTTSALSQQLMGAGQMLARLRTLAQLVAPRNADERFRRGLRLFQKLVEEQNLETSLRHLWQRSTNMLALQITEHAGKTGEHYVAGSRSEWFEMFRAAFGAGLIVGLMALFKIGITAAGLPPLWNALAVSLNYALGFVVVHLLHFTIATKQPAMTAALIASTVRSSRRGYRSISHLATLIIGIFRTQMVAIAGNVLAAFPMAVALFYGMAWLLGPDWISPDKAAHLIHDQHPFASLALVHAAIAGVCLYLAGVVAGYYDNLGAIARIPARLRRAPWLAWLSDSARARLASYIERNLGALAGNIVFGFLLGMSAFVGLLIGAPIDIRHVTFAAANLAFGAAASGWSLPWHSFALLGFGVFAIGMINLGVSFTLALATALRANGIRLTDQRRLWEAIKRRFLRSPTAFLWPPAARTPKP